MNNKNQNSTCNGKNPKNSVRFDETIIDALENIETEKAILEAIIKSTNGHWPKKEKRTTLTPTPEHYLNKRNN